MKNLEDIVGKLGITAQRINMITDNLSTEIATLNAQLKKLNLGIEVWVRLPGNEPYNPNDVGYSKVHGTWGILIRSTYIDEADTKQDSETVWAFDKAPRLLRLLAVDALPELLGELEKKASDMAVALQQRVKDTEQILTRIAETEHKP